MAAHEMNQGSMAQALNNAGLGNEEQVRREQPRRESTSSQRESQPPRRTNIASFASGLSRGMTISANGQVAKDWAEAAIHLFKENYVERPNRTNFDRTILTLDVASDRECPISSLLVVYSFRSQTGRPVALVSVAGLAASLTNGNPIREYRPLNGGKPIPDVEYVPSSLLDDYYATLVEKKVRSALGSDYEVFIVGNFVIPRGLKADVENQDVKQAIMNMGNMIEDKYDREFNSRPEFVDVKTVVQDTSAVNLALVTHDRPTTSMVGLPSREDVSLDLSVQIKSENPAVPDSVFPVSHLGGYVTLDYAPGDKYDARGNEITQRLAPKFVITSQRPSYDSPLASLELALLGMAQAPRLADNGRWRGLFLSKVTAGIPGRDAGNFGYEVAYGDSRSPEGYEADFKNLSEEEQLKFIDRACFDDLTVALAYDDSDPYAWINAPFLDAEDANAAGYKAIVASVDHLTDGRFSPKWDFSQPIAVQSGIYLHNGFYFENNDRENPRSLLDIDTQWVWDAWGKRNPDMAIQFSDTMYSSDEPVIQLDKRRHLLKSVLEDHQVTGIVQLIDINVEFLTLIAECTVKEGLSVRTNDGMLDDRASRGRAYYRRSQGLDSRDAGRIYRGGDDVNQGRNRGGISQGRMNRGYRN